MLKPNAVAPSNALPLVWLARLGWALVFVLVLAILGEMIPRNFHDTAAEWTVQQARPAVVRMMAFQHYVLILTTLETLVSAVYIAIACLIFWRRPDDWVAIFVSLTLLVLALSFGISSNLEAWRYPSLLVRWAPWFPGLFLRVALCCTLLLFFLFPNGKVVNRWMGWLAAASVLTILLLYTPLVSALAPAWFQAQADPTWAVTMLTLFGAALVALVGQSQRYRRLASPVERQQIKWVLFGLALPVLFAVSHFLLNTALGWSSAPTAWALSLVIGLLVNLVLPVALALAILRYRLWEIDLLLNRALVYTMLTGLVALLYILSVGLLGALSQRQSDYVVPLLGLLVVGGALLPLRSWLQSMADQVIPIVDGERSATPSVGTRANDATTAKTSGAVTTKADRWLFGAGVAVFTTLAVLWLLAGATPGSELFYPPLMRWLRLSARTVEWPLLRTVAGGLTMAKYYSEPPLLLLFEYLFSVVNLGLGLALLFRRPDDWVARLLALGMIGTAAIFNLQAHSVLTATGWPAVEAAHAVLHLVAGGSYTLALVLFPEGRLPPTPFRWLGPLRVITLPLQVIFLVILVILVSAFTFDGEPAAFVLFYGLVAPVVGITAQALRYRATSDPDQRRLSRTVMLALALGLALTLVIALSSWVLFSPLFGVSFAVRRSIERVTFFAFPLLYLMIPVALWLIVLRHRLWELDILINRSLVYGVLTTAIALLYITAVGALGVALRGQASWLVAVLATGLIAILFHPLRQQLQRRVNRLMYGQRDDPVTVLAALRTRLIDTSTPEMVLAATVETLCHALKLPYAAIALKQGEELRIAASFGQTHEEVETIPLFYQREWVGEMRVARRSPGEGLSPADHRLLGEVAQQAGAAVHAATLTADLQQSRARLVTAREEERRRLRRDLHDGLGPQLATLSLKLEAARNILRNDQAETDRLLAEVKTEMQSAIADIRRLVYDLRPPALDQLGLVSALREYTSSYPGRNGLRITVDTPDTLPTLPAAVEVAAYRIALEAITNVVRHAQAHQCTVSLRCAQELILEVSDDGIGLSPGYQAGVGLLSMRERVAELGGICRVESAANGGTRVLARLPLLLHEREDYGTEPLG